MMTFFTKFNHSNQSKISLLGACILVISSQDPLLAESNLTFLNDSPVEIKLDTHAFLDWGKVESDKGVDVNATELRLFRIGLSGNYGPFKFTGQVDFGNDDVNVQDLYLKYKTGAGTLIVGQYKPPNTLEFSSSVYATTFMEAASIVKAFGPGRRLGLAFQTANEGLNFHGGIYSGNLNNQDLNDQWALIGRFSYGTALGNMENSVGHVGLSLRYREAGDSAHRIKLAQKPFSDITNNKYVSTGALADSDFFVGVEGALVLDRLSVQGEYGLVKSDCGLGLCPAGDPTFHSFYVDASLFFGGRRNYSFKNAVFGRQKIDAPYGNGGHGALELAIRYDMIDLTDAGIMGGKQDSIIVGGTYYVNKYVRFLLNYSHSDIKGSPLIGDDDVNTISARLQLELY